MPDARLARTRASLPMDADYQFGDMGIEDWPDPSPTVKAAAERYLLRRGIRTSHRADTLDPPGYGHAV